MDVVATDLHTYHFDPGPWMHPFDAACYLEPRILEYDAGECPLPVSKFRASRAEAITYVQTPVMIWLIALFARNSEPIFLWTTFLTCTLVLSPRHREY